MPSGPKKRKAAKRKKVKEANDSTSATHSHGDNDLKHHDDKESDSGEVSSPASQHHHNHHHPFTGGEEMEAKMREDSSSVQSFASENKSIKGESMQNAAREEEGSIQIDRVLKSEEDFKSKNIAIQSPKESRDGSSSKSSSSSSSDDESHVVVKNTVVLETAPAVDSVKPVDSLYEKVTQVNGDLAVETSHIFDSVKPTDSLSEVVSQANDNTMVEGANNLVFETPSVAGSDTVSLLEQTVHLHGCASVDNYLASGVVESVVKETGEKKLPSLDEDTGVSPVLMELESQKKEDEAVSTSNENKGASSESKDYVMASTYAKGTVSEENEDKLLLSFNAPRADPSNGAEHVKESETPQYSNSQPLVALAPRTAQTTSWKSCCGIFELITGSNR